MKNINFIFSKLKWDIKRLPSNSTIIFINPFSYLLLRKSMILEKVDFIGVDGGLLKTIFNLFLEDKIHRKSFDNTSLAPALYKHCIDERKSIYFIGSTDINIKKFHQIIHENIIDLSIIGCHNGYIKSISEKKCIADKIINLNPDYVIVGMGTPNQENFILYLKERGYKGIAFTCGGYFHQTTRGLNYYPPIFDKLNLRWFYRIIDEPKLIKRYFIYYPIALFYILLDLYSYKKD